MAEDPLWWGSPPSSVIVQGGPAVPSVVGVSAVPTPEPAVAAPTSAPAEERTSADRVMRRVLLLPADAPKQSIFGSESVFGKSIAISAVRCLITYVALPLLGPVIKLSSTVGPILGLVLGAVSMVAIWFSMRRFFAADHKWRWPYAAVGGGIFVLLIVAGIYDISTLASA